VHNTPAALQPPLETPAYSSRPGPLRRNPLRPEASGISEPAPEWDHREEQARRATFARRSETFAAAMGLPARR